MLELGSMLALSIGTGTFALSHFRTENRIPLFLKML